MIFLNQVELIQQGIIMRSALMAIAGLAAIGYIAQRFIPFDHAYGNSGRVHRR